MYLFNQSNQSNSFNENGTKLGSLQGVQADYDPAAYPFSGNYVSLMAIEMHIV